DVEVPRLVERALRGGGWADEPRLVGELDMASIAVELGVDGDRPHAELARRADHPDGDLASVSDENRLHKSTLRTEYSVLGTGRMCLDAVGLAMCTIFDAWRCGRKGADWP